ncbi:MAG: hypothetical protein V3S02_03000 [Dehalococcoidales bacterium]
MNNSEIAENFDEIAGLLRAGRENVFKIRAYRTAAAVIRDLPEPVEQMVREERLREISGVGEAISKKINELVDTGQLEYLQRLRDGLAEAKDGQS